MAEGHFDPLPPPGSRLPERRAKFIDVDAYMKVKDSTDVDDSALAAVSGGLLYRAPSATGTATLPRNPIPTITANDYESTCPPSAIHPTVDPPVSGADGSYWKAKYGPYWLHWDFPSAHRFVSATYYSPIEGGLFGTVHMTGCYIQYSLNDVDWVTVKTWTSGLGDSGEETELDWSELPLVPAARYWKLVITSTAPYDNYVKVDNWRWVEATGESETWKGLPHGGDAQVLMVNSAADEGIEWHDASDHEHVEADITNLDHWDATDTDARIALADLADLATQPHSALSGVGTDDHHAQVHAIGGADHTGSLAHSDLASVGASDHHTKYTDTEAAAKIAADDLYVKNAGDAMTGQLLADFGSSSLPGVAFDGDSDTGMYRWAANEIGFASGGTPRMVVGYSLSFGHANAGSTGFELGPTGLSAGAAVAFMDFHTGGGADYDARLRADGGHASTAGQGYLTVNALQLRAPFGTESLPGIAFDADSDSGMRRRGADNIGLVVAGTDELILSTTQLVVPNVYNDSTTGSANVIVASNGRLQRTTSARKYKKYIKAVPELADIKLRPVRYQSKYKDANDVYYGFIADELADQDERLGVYPDGELEDYDTRAVIAVLAAKINRLERQVESLLSK